MTPGRDGTRGGESEHETGELENVGPDHDMGTRSSGLSQERV